MTQKSQGVTGESRGVGKPSPLAVPYRAVPSRALSPSADSSNSGTHSPSLGGAGGPKEIGPEYDGISPRWEDHSSDLVPVRSWHRLKWKLDKLGLRLEFEADYRRERDALDEKHGLPLRGGVPQVVGYEREVQLFKRWHVRAWGQAPARWPWVAPEVD